MDIRRCTFGLIAMLLVGLAACRTPRQQCYEANRCDSAEITCLAINGMLLGSLTPVGSMLPGTDLEPNNTLSGATSLQPPDSPTRL